MPPVYHHPLIFFREKNVAVIEVKVECIACMANLTNID